MPISEYMQRLRDAVGHRLLLVPSVAAIIRDDRGRVLLMQDALSNQWSLPAGAIEPGESPAEAIAREVEEETSLRVQNAELVAAVGGKQFRTQYPNGDQVEYTVCVYACQVEQGDPVARDGEASSFRWVAADDVPGWLDLPYPPALFGSRR